MRLDFCETTYDESAFLFLVYLFETIILLLTPRLAEPALVDPQCSHSHSHSCNVWAHQRGSLSAAHSRDQTGATEGRDKLAPPPQEVMVQQSEHKSSCPPPVFVEITRSLWGECSQLVAVGVPAGEDEVPYEAFCSSIMATQLFWHPTSGEMFTDMLTCTLSVVDLGVDPMVEVHLVPALQEHSDSDWTQWDDLIYILRS